MHARNMKVSVELLNTVKHWRKEASSTMGNPWLAMVDIYLTSEALLLTVLRFLRSL